MSKKQKTTLKSSKIIPTTTLQSLKLKMKDLETRLYRINKGGSFKGINLTQDGSERKKILNEIEELKKKINCELQLKSSKIISTRKEDEKHLISIESNVSIMKPMVFLNTMWMEYYKGEDIKVYGGGAAVKEIGYGHEMYNFKEINGKVYGYVRPSNGNKNDLSRLGGKKKEKYVDNILIVFTAKHKKGGVYIVGWYSNARFYNDYQPTNMKERQNTKEQYYYEDDYIGYYAEADAENAVLLSEDERFSFPKIPIATKRKKGGMGQSNVWYADANEMVDFKLDVLNHINNYIKNKSNNSILIEDEFESEFYNENAPEGKKVQYLTAKYERSQKNRTAAIRIHGLSCYVCDFNFENTYGEIGKDFIEVHHCIPLYSKDEIVNINPKTDLICVCANCHRMLHRKRKRILKPDELKSIVKT